MNSTLIMGWTLRQWGYVFNLAGTLGKHDIERMAEGDLSPAIGLQAEWQARHLGDPPDGWSIITTWEFPSHPQATAALRRGIHYIDNLSTTLDNTEEGQ